MQASGSGLLLHLYMRAVEILSANLKRLMQVTGNPSSSPAVDRVAKNLGLSLGRTTVARYAHGDGNPSLEHVETLAKVFGIHAWQLLHPTMGQDGGNTMDVAIGCQKKRDNL